MACNLIGDAPDFGGLCLSWVQEQLHLPHEGATAADAWTLYSGRGAATSSPGSGDLVFFGNGAAGHVGIYNGFGSFRSVWSSGSICDSSVQSFAAENGMTVLGYISVGKLSGATTSASPSPAAASPAVATPQFSIPKGVIGVALVGLGALLFMENL